MLANPQVPHETFDDLKYIPLSADYPSDYLSLGLNVRERFESNNAAAFGTGANQNANYLLSRSEIHADANFRDRFKFFFQLQSAFAPWKQMPTPVDLNSLDLEQAFIVLTEPVGEGLLKVRLGRQQFAFDLQRFVSVRDGPNVRQSFDAGWFAYEQDPWRVIGLYSWPVQVQNLRPFDDYSSNQLTFTMGRVEHKWNEDAFLAAYYARYTNGAARYLGASGVEARNIVDVHFAANGNGFDFDFEGMMQSGTVGAKNIWAWALGSLGGYTFTGLPGKPRLGLQFDMASGTADRAGNTVGTFNPLFPNGYYFTLAGYTGYANLIHLKPSVTFRPTASTRLLLAVAAQWRQNTADAVYVQPNVAVTGTAGQPGSYTGAYGQLRFDWAITPNVSFAVEAVHFAVGDVIRQAGGRNADYVGVQLSFGW